MYSQYYIDEKQWQDSEEKKARDSALDKLNIQGAKDAENKDILPIEALQLVNDVFADIDLDHLNLEEKEIVLVIGHTGSGKSTTISWLMGAQMEEFIDEAGSLRVKVAQHPELYPVIGQDVESQTLKPEIFTIQDNSTLLVDCAGFYDNRGVLKALIALVGIDYVITRAKNIKGVLNVLPYDSGDARLGYINRGIEQIKKIFPRLDAALLQSLLLLLTKAPDTFRKTGLLSQIERVQALETQKSKDTKLPESSRLEATQNSVILGLIAENANRLWVPNILNRPLQAENGFIKAPELINLINNLNVLNKDSIKLDRAIPEIESLRMVLFAIADEFISWARNCAALKNDIHLLKTEQQQVQASLKDYRRQKQDCMEGKNQVGVAIAAKRNEIQNKESLKAQKQARINAILRHELPPITGKIAETSSTHHHLIYENSSSGGGFFWSGHDAWFEYHAPAGCKISKVTRNLREGKFTCEEGGSNHSYYKVKLESTGGFLGLDQKADGDVQVYLRYCDVPSVAAERERANRRKAELESEYATLSAEITQIESDINALNSEITNLQIDNALLQKTIDQSIKKLEARENELPGLIQSKKEERRQYQFWVYHSLKEIVYLGSLFKDVKVLEPSPSLSQEYEAFFSKEARANFKKLYGPAKSSVQFGLFQAENNDPMEVEMAVSNNNNNKRRR